MVESVNRDKNGRFVQGNKSNGGRKPIPPEIKEALTGLVPRAIERLSLIINDSVDDKLVMEAVKVVLDRVYGKPQQAIDIDAKVDGSMQIVITGEVEEWAN